MIVKLSIDDLPMFFDDAHRAVADRVRAAMPVVEAAQHDDRASFEALRPLLDLTREPISARSLCLAREALGQVSPRADSIFAVQGLGTFPFLRTNHPVPASMIGAFALTEPDAGSDVAAIATRATPPDDGGDGGDAWRLDGDKLFISNLGIATDAVVFATIDPAQGRKGITAFHVAIDQPGVEVEPIEPIAPHPLGALKLRGARGTLLGERGGGFRLAMETLDTYRVSVGAAAVGMARRALDEAVAFVRERKQFGKPLAEQPLIWAHAADMTVDLDAARLLVLRAAWARDQPGARATLEVSIAKLHATEAAQRIIDAAVQLFGGRGVVRGAVVEHLYRAIRPLRIYEGTSEIQRTIIGRAALGLR